MTIVFNIIFLHKANIRSLYVTVSFKNLYACGIFNKNRSLYLKNTDIRQQLFSYIAKTIFDNDSFPIKIGGYDDHIHIFLNLSKNICLKDMIRIIKKSSSRWIKSKGDDFLKFYWQTGYGAFSVGEAQKEKTINYINNQEEHHKKISFQDELRMFMDKNNMEYNEKYIWD